MGLAGYGLGYTTGGATKQDNDQLGQCANDSTQLQSFIQGFTDNGGVKYNAAEINITLPDGHILSISGEVYPTTNKPAGPECSSQG